MRFMYCKRTRKNGAKAHVHVYTCTCMLFMYLYNFMYNTGVSRELPSACVYTCRGGVVALLVDWWEKNVCMEALQPPLTHRG